MNIEAHLSQLVSSPITAVAWKKDRTAVAISTGDEKILVYTKNGEQWSLHDTLAEHDQRITGLDWFSGPEGDRILSCSADRNAYVWTQTPSSRTWKPSLVLLRFKRAATCAQWSPDGSKFAVGGSEGLVAVAHYEREHDWWVSKHLKKGIEGPVLSVSWHSSSLMVAVGTLSGMVHMLSAWVGEVDEGKTCDASWIDKDLMTTFDSELFSVKVGTWIHAIAFSPSGKAMAWSTQDAIITVYHPESGNQSSLQHFTDGKKLPLQKLLFLSENVLMAAGSGGVPILLSGADGKEWKVRAELTSDTIGSKKSTAGSIAARMSKFQMMDQQGQSADEIASKASKAGSSTAHISAISSLESMHMAGKSTEMVATVGLDGRLVVWHVGELASQYEMEAAQI